MSANRPFIRIAATYPTTDDGRLPDSVEVELDVDDVEEETPLPDGDEFPSGGFTRFVTEVVRALRGGAPTAQDVHVFAFNAGDVEKLERLAEHAPGCDGTCDQPASPARAEPAAEDRPDGAPAAEPPAQPADAEPTLASEKGGA